MGIPLHAPARFSWPLWPIPRPRHNDFKLRQELVTNALGQTSLTVYDDANRPVVSVQNWDGVTTIESTADCQFPPAQPDVNVCSATVYDRMGRRAQSINPLGHVTDVGYDGLGRQITTTRYLDGQPVTTLSHYDARGSRYAQTDARGNTTTYLYDTLNRQIATVTAEGVGSYQTYDENYHLGRAMQL